MQGPVDVARHPHEQPCLPLRLPIRHREDVPPRRQLQLRPVGRYQHPELRHRQAPQAHL